MLEKAKETLKLEAEAILAMASRLDESYVAAVELLFRCRGRVVVTGMGKSGLVATKLAATFSSTGTPALFLHPAEGNHGDVGMVTSEDVVLALSNSGETWELLSLLPVLKRLGPRLISLVGRPGSTLARESDVVLDVSVVREACPLGLAPTCSTTAALAMGDALAVSLLEKRGFDSEQFALFHPGGALGQRLLLRVADRMHTGEEIPMVGAQETMREALLEMTAKRLGVTGVHRGDGILVGIITDGDLRRHLERYPDLLTLRVGEVMTPNPKRIDAGALAVEAIRVMEESKISCLFVGARGEPPAGVIHLHDLLAAGLG
ncbi:MAG: KpsF/GutQ family sugar-phosphate isomerase [Magnetococcales bacterium]|nr:KpsF/GutQ family sugar-phosphate isomerase [Magnetococcales bacterium]MBF0156819.1 KpsF/GutQ family sugar-phosphate isomerase [Magnetococcales bacterium]